MLEIVCVALAVYFESRGEPTAGQHAVASVVWNRKYDSRWPNNACDVVMQRGQFESYPFPQNHVIHSASWNRALEAASATANEPTTPALFFSTPGLLPYTPIERIGNHVFYVP